MRPVMSAYYKSIHEFAKYLCRAMALAMGVPENSFDEAVAQPESRLRLLHSHRRKHRLPRTAWAPGRIPIAGA